MRCHALRRVVFSVPTRSLCRPGTPSFRIWHSLWCLLNASRDLTRLIHVAYSSVCFKIVVRLGGGAFHLCVLRGGAFILFLKGVVPSSPPLGRGKYHTKGRRENTTQVKRRRGKGTTTPKEGGREQHQPKGGWWCFPQRPLGWCCFCPSLLWVVLLFPPPSSITVVVLSPYLPFWVAMLCSCLRLCGAALHSIIGSGANVCCSTG